MATGTSSSALDRVAHLGAALRGIVTRRPVALLVLRVRDFERVAWRDGREAARGFAVQTAGAFRAAACEVLRPDDRAAHDDDSDLFLIGMFSKPRSGRVPLPVDCRATLQRVAARLRDTATLDLETGWTIVGARPPRCNLRREIERALERGARERERHEFFATVGHELRTPLTAIRGYLETLLEDAVDPSTRRRFLATAAREAARLGRLVDGMLDFSLLDLSADALAFVSCDLSEQIGAACDAVSPLAARRPVSLERAFVPPVSVGLSADGCTQALLNVLENAVKYSRADGRIRVSGEIRAPYVCVRVDDDGDGLRACERRRIFDYRGRGGAVHAEGRGLGLTIVKTIVQRAGGEVRAERSPLGGARFELRLPIRAEFLPPLS